MNRGISNEDLEFNPIVVSSHDDIIKQAMKIMGQTGRAIVCVGNTFVGCEAAMKIIARDLEPKAISLEVIKENKTYPEYGWYRKFDKRKR